MWKKNVPNMDVLSISMLTSKFINVLTLSINALSLSFILFFPCTLCAYLPFYNQLILYAEEVQVLCICSLTRWKQQVLLNEQCTRGGLQAE